MNKSMSKRTYRGNACIQKGISWIFCDTKEGEIVFEKTGNQENERSNTKGNETGCEFETRWRKTRSDEKRTEEKLDERKSQNVLFRERFIV